MARSDSINQQIQEQIGRKFFIQKIALTASTGVCTSITATDIYGNTVPQGATLMVQFIGTDAYYELREAGATTTITDTTGARPGTYVTATLQEYVLRLGSPGNNTNIKPAADAKIDILPVSNGTALVFWVG